MRWRTRGARNPRKTLRGKAAGVALMLAAQMASSADGAAADVRPHLAQDFAANLL